VKTETLPSYLNNRVLKLNVGFLLSDGPGHSRDMTFDFPAVRVSDDMLLHFLQGELRISRTKEGLLLQGKFAAGIEDQCSRCLDDVERELALDVEELIAYPDPSRAEFSVSDDGILDLAPLIRAEALIAMSRRALCRPDCRGLCAECGANLNYELCTCHADEIDPRLAKLKELLKPSK
jgi:uncharacterized protein